MKGYIKFISIFLVTLLTLFNLCFGDTTNCLESILEYSEEVHVDHSQILSPERLTARRYEVELSRSSNLSIEEILGITRNFSAEKFPADGSIGVFRIGDDFVVDASVNLVNAYKTMYPKIRPGTISATDIIQLRKKALHVLMRDGDDLKDVPLKLKGKKDFANLEEGIHPEVIQKLKDYGYGVRKKNIGWRIKYSVASDDKRLALFTAKLNKIIKDGYPPEYIATFAVQELLIIHPFVDGNGRTARLLGQIIFRKLTGKTIIFPKEFKLELNYSLDELTKLLVPRNSPSSSALNRSVFPNNFANNFLINKLNGKLYREGIGPPEKMKDVPPIAKGADIDRPFKKMVINGTEYNSHTLPVTTSHTATSGYLFHGMKANDDETAIRIIKRAFSTGKRQRKVTHHDLTQHILGTKENFSDNALTSTTRSSAFVATSKEMKISKKMADLAYQTDKRGIVFIIDPRGAKVVDVKEMLISADAANPVKLNKAHKNTKQEMKVMGYAMNESEVLFYRSIAPSRIYGAYVKIREDKYKYYLNPNYRPR